MLERVAAALTILLTLSTANAAPRKDDAERAFELFDKSAESYRAGRFAESAAMLREAYKLNHAPILLYNLGRALEGMGELKGAIDAYRSYLASAAKITDRQSLEQRIVTLQKTIADRETLEDRLARERAESATKLELERAESERLVADARAHADDRPMTRARVGAPWIVASIGAAGFIAGGALAGLARARHEAAESNPSADNATNQQTQARELALGANIAFGVSGVIVAVGVIWGVVDLVHRHKKARESRSFAAISR
jgi:tetratricopeptide (TPR) repeat protein